MRLLVLGGTVFLSRAIAEQALARGHEVVCAARGTSGPPPAGVRFVTVDRDDAQGLRELAASEYDAVVDVESMSVSRVRRALAALGDRTGHWTYVSTASVYADTRTPGQRAATAPLVPPAPEAADGDVEQYGNLKVACEEAVRASVGDRSFLCRPGLIVGPGDRSDRFGYWPARLAGTGPVLAPGDPEALVQYLDVRDCAAWIVAAAEQGLVATLDAVCPSLSWSDLLHGIGAAIGSNPELVWVPQSVLEEHEVTPWAGPDSLPLWVPWPEYAGFGARDVTDSLGAGLRIRPLAETAVASLEYERGLGLDRDRKAGLRPHRERAVLAAYAGG